MIIWIASYPKSGNTWIRSIISSYFFSDTGKFNFDLLENIPQYPSSKYFKFPIKKPGEVSLYWKSTQDELSKNNKNVFLKTHNAMVALNGRDFTSSTNTLGSIYIVRDPRNIISSMKNHYDFDDYSETFDFMVNKKKFIWDERENNNYSSFQFLGSWSDHYKSWLKNSSFKTLLVKYEDLEKDCYSTSLKIIEFINFLKGENVKVDEKKLFNCIQTTNFDILKKKEIETGFQESIKYKDKKKDFFYLGPKNKWQEKLPKDILSRVKKEFIDDLKYFNYSLD